ncbi:MAG: hypothetical protein K8R90_02640 [Candidatus Cloacimonetes bacterium]|nr:hypothetical protein [Candidatus Cloacimonadota bacterium]
MNIARVIIICLAALVSLLACGKKAEPTPEPVADTLMQVEPVGLPQTVHPQEQRPQATRPAASQPAAATRKTVSVDDLPALVDAHKDRLNRIYLEYSKLLEMGGRVEFAITLTKDGVIERVDSTPSEGARFSEEFLEMAREDIGSWNLPVDQAHVYRFRMTFMK